MILRDKIGSMKTYRVIARWLGWVFRADVKASTDQQAEEEFAKTVRDGKASMIKDEFYRPDRLYVTLEEVTNDSDSRSEPTS